MKHKHMSLDDRLEIEKGLKEKLSFKQIAENIGKDCTTISKEIKKHLVFKNVGTHGRPFNNCIHRKNCVFKEKAKLCNIHTCSHYEKEECLKLNKPPYVCNGCSCKHTCTLTKKIYDSTYSFKEYNETLKSTREGITFTEEQLNHLNNILLPLLKEQGQSIHHAYINNRDTIMCSEKEIYNLIDLGLLDIKNQDLPRKVRYRQRPRNNFYYKIDKKCLESRKYEDFKKFIENNPDVNVVEMDTVEGVKGGKVLLTIHFVNCSFMLIFIREHNDSQSVIDIFNMLEDKLGLNVFRKLFIVILTDNGSEFTNPTKIEINNKGKDRTKIFYCEPGRSDQKGSCEVNHEQIRRVLPKGTSFNNLTQEDINLLMSHINSYKRKKLNDCSPIQLFNLMYGSDVTSKLGIAEINPNEVNLTKDLLKK